MYEGVFSSYSPITLWFTWNLKLETENYESAISSFKGAITPVEQAAYFFNGLDSGSIDPFRADVTITSQR